VRAVSRLLGSLLNEIDPPDTPAAPADDTGPRRNYGAAASLAYRIDRQQTDRRCPTHWHLDIVEDFAYPLPAIIGQTFWASRTGSPPVWTVDRQCRAHIQRRIQRHCAMRRGEESVIQLTDYLKKLLTERRERPGHDVLTAMLQSHEATEDERVLMAANITMGMYENVTPRHQPLDEYDLADSWTSRVLPKLPRQHSVVR